LHSTLNYDKNKRLIKYVYTKTKDKKSIPTLIGYHAEHSGEVQIIRLSTRMKENTNFVEGFNRLGCV